MKLRWSPTSPYARKVMICAHELGLVEQIEVVPTNPWEPASRLREHNPLSQVPTLILDDGTILYDSPVCCEYLNDLAGGQLFPRDRSYWQARRNQALADGLITTFVFRFVEEHRRTPEQRSEWWMGLQTDSALSALDAFERMITGFSDQPEIGQIALACALGYIHFRFPEFDWRSDRPQLGSWFDTFAQRPSVQATVPRDPT